MELLQAFYYVAAGTGAIMLGVAAIFRAGNRRK